MRKGKSICKQLGIKQDELAMLLNISKGQLAMFETGKRELPTSAMQQLAPMLKYMHEESLKSSSAEILKSQEEQQKKVLEHLLKENKYFQTEVSKKLEMAKRKYQANVSAIQLVRFLEKEAPGTALIKRIEARATTELEKNGLGVLTKYKIQKEVLQAEEKMLLKLLG
jgi:transcriptional regulator with XRE-family HTH domain